MYVRYKCQPEAQITSAGWDLATSQRYADQLAAEEQQAYVREESLLYNGLAPTSISLRITEAPAEFAVPVKQDRCACRSCAGWGGGAWWWDWTSTLGRGGGAIGEVTCGTGGGGGDVRDSAAVWFLAAKKGNCVLLSPAVATLQSKVLTYGSHQPTGARSGRNTVATKCSWPRTVATLLRAECCCTLRDKSFCNRRSFAVTPRQQ
jgi:hypothetical protein